MSAAFTLEKHRRAGASLEYVLFESSPRLGGVLVTDRVEGCRVEAGPDSFLTEIAAFAIAFPVTSCTAPLNVAELSLDCAGSVTEPTAKKKTHTRRANP